MTQPDTSSATAQMAAPPAPAELFNGHVGSSAVAALHQLGVLDALLGSVQGVSADRLAEQCGADTALLEALLSVLMRLGYADVQDGRWSLTQAGEELARHAGFFGWLVAGYGRLFSNLAPLATSELRYGRDIGRDEAAVAHYSGSVDAAWMTPVLYRVLDELDFRFFADLGCGGANRLISLCQRYPDVRGLGIDISAAACELARRNVAAAQLTDRVRVMNRDVRELIADPDASLGEVDMVGSFLMLHDLLQTDPSGRELFASLRRAFPRATRYVIADTVVMESTPPADELPIFALGYETAHAFMATPLYSKRRYEQVFADSGLVIERCLPFGAPNTWLFVLSAR